MPNSVRWYYNLSKWNPSFQDVLLATSCIQTEEKERLGKFYFKKDFQSSLIGRLLMRKFVSNNSDKVYNKIIFERDEKGKPYLKNNQEYPKLSFNVSHHGNFSVLAGETDAISLGVDVMKLAYTGGKPLSEFFRIMRRNLSDFEWETIQSNPDEKFQEMMFCRFWCLKESYLKATGVGVASDALREISFKINTKELSRDCLVKDTELYVKGTKMIDWCFHEMLLDDDHCTAVASNKNIEGVIFKEICFTELIKGSVPLIPTDEEYCRKYFEKMDKK